MNERVALLIAGAIGGVINTLLAGGKLLFPYLDRDDAGHSILMPGFIGNTLVGAVTGLVFWAFNNPNVDWASQTIRAFPVIASLLAGVGGGQVLSGYVQRAILQDNLNRMTGALAELEEAAARFEREARDQGSSVTGRPESGG